jgi:hypothetical protein
MGKHALQTLAAAVLAAALSGCAAVDQARQAQQQEDLARARESCARFADSAPGFSACVETQLAVISNQRRGALGAQSAPTHVQSYGPRGQLCVPTAAGPDVTC